MAKNETKRLRPAQIQANKDHFANLKQIAAYTPANPAYTVALIEASETALNADGAAEAQALVAAAAARDAAVLKNRAKGADSRNSSPLAI